MKVSTAKMKIRDAKMTLLAATMKAKVLAAIMKILAAKMILLAALMKTKVLAVIMKVLAAKMKDRPVKMRAVAAKMIAITA